MLDHHGHLLRSLDAGELLPNRNGWKSSWSDSRVPNVATGGRAMMRTRRLLRRAPYCRIGFLGYRLMPGSARPDLLRSVVEDRIEENRCFLVPTVVSGTAMQQSRTRSLWSRTRLGRHHQHGHNAISEP